jgi:DNA repair exonuclease SbcCD ATPase subunit
MESVMKKDNKYKWKQHMLYASKSNNLARAEKEWVYFADSYVPDGEDNCLCSARIKNKYKIVNAKNGHVAFVGRSCLKKIVPPGTKIGSSKHAPFTGPPVEYDDLDIEAYLRHCASICGALDLQMAQEQLERVRLERKLLELQRQEQREREQLELQRQEHRELQRQKQRELQLQKQRERELLELESRKQREHKRLEQLELERKRLSQLEQLELERKRLSQLEHKRLEQLERKRKHLEHLELERKRLEPLQLTFLENEAKRYIKKTGEPTPTKVYLQSYMEQMRAGLSNHEWALVLSKRKRTTYATEKIKIDLLFPY